MNELISIKSNIINGAEVNSVNARDLHKALDSRQEFANWIKKRLERFNEDVDYIVFDKSIKNPNGGRPQTEYIITIDTAKMISMLENNIKGDEVRKYFIQCEKDLNKPMSFEEMARQTILLADKRIKELENKIEQDKPHTQFGKAIAESATAIKVGDWIKAVNEDGTLKMGRNKAFKWFRENGYIMTDNQPYQKYIDMGLFEVKENLIVTSKGQMVKFTTLLTGKGQEYFLMKLEEK